LNSKEANNIPRKGAQSSNRAMAFVGISMIGECFMPYIIYKGSDKITEHVWWEFDSPKVFVSKNRDEICSAR
jgi:Mn2+/Fe2+ NRAMP family transporter